MTDAPEFSEIAVRMEIVRHGIAANISIEEIDRLTKYVTTGELPEAPVPDPVEERLAALEQQVAAMGVRGQPHRDLGLAQRPTEGVLSSGFRS